jgi:hypothetical protein
MVDYSKIGVEVYMHLGQTSNLNDYTLNVDLEFNKDGDYLRVLKNLKDTRTIIGGINPKKIKRGISIFMKFIGEDRFNTFHTLGETQSEKFKHSNKAIVKFKQLKGVSSDYLTNNNEKIEVFALSINFHLKTIFHDRTKTRTVKDMVITIVGTKKKDFIEILKEIIINYKDLLKNILPKKDYPKFNEQLLPAIQCNQIVSFVYHSDWGKPIPEYMSLTENDSEAFINQTKITSVTKSINKNVNSEVKKTVNSIKEKSKPTPSSINTKGLKDVDPDYLKKIMDDARKRK